MKLCFDSIEEVKEFVTQLKGTRGKKGEADDAGTATGSAPQPLQPPTGGPSSGFPSGGPAGFAAPGAGAGPAAGGFPAAGAPTVAPEVAALVQRITTRVEAAVSSGTTKPEDMITWFRGQCGAGAEAATWDQIKTSFLPKMAVPQLDGIAKMVNA